MGPATGYELSIYSATPLIFWITVIIGLFHGIFIVTLALYERIGKIWIIGLFEIIFFNILAISLYALRGYVLYLGRGDAASYVGMAMDVSNYGIILDYNFYPIVSILISQIGQIANIPIIDISKYISSFFFVIYILSIYCLSKSIHDNKKFIFTCIIASTPILFPWFSTSAYHMLLSVLTIPMLFYYIQKSSDNRFRFFSVIWIVISPLFHPITVIMVFIYLLVTYLHEKHMYNESKISIFLILISFVSFVGWFISQYILLGDAKRIILQIFHFLDTQSTASQADYYITKLGLSNIVRSFLFMDAHIIILFTISLVAVYYIIKNRKSEMNLASTAICFLIGNIFIIIVFFTSKTHTPDRLINLNPNMILMQTLIGYLIYKFSCEKRDMATIFLVGLIMISSMMSIFALYQSPIVTYPGDHMTNNDVSSMTWLLSNKNPNLRTIDIMGPISRYAEMIYGYNFKFQRNDLYRDIVLPDHFGFSNNDTFPIDKDRYLVITKYDIQSYTEVWEDVNRFEEQDFINMELLKNVDNIYDSKEVLFYLIRKY